jgi:hypothetical protein
MKYSLVLAALFGAALANPYGPGWRHGKGKDDEDDDDDKHGW